GDKHHPAVVGPTEAPARGREPVEPLGQALAVGTQDRSRRRMRRGDAFIDAGPAEARVGADDPVAELAVAAVLDAGGERDAAAAVGEGADRLLGRREAVV